MPSCVPFLEAHSEICKASGFVIKMEPADFVLTKQVNDFFIESVIFRKLMIMAFMNII